jgi:predicted DNA-binding transcriptional regulator AlpA
MSKKVISPKSAPPPGKTHKRGRIKHQIDRRARSLIAALQSEGAPDDIFMTLALAEATGQSHQFYELARFHGYGPKFIKIGNMVGYRRSDILAWLRERATFFETNHPKRKLYTESQGNILRLIGVTEPAE